MTKDRPILEDESGPNNDPISYLGYKLILEPTENNQRLLTGFQD